MSFRANACSYAIALTTNSSSADEIIPTELLILKLEDEEIHAYSATPGEQNSCMGTLFYMRL